MRVLLASAAYLTVAAGGVKILLAGAHSLATAASPFLLLPPAPNPAPSLVERRLIVQAAPAPAYVPLRRVVALKAPEIPLAQLALGLDEAETAYEPPRAVSVTEVLEAKVVAPAIVQDTINESTPPLLQVAALEITRAQFGQPTIALPAKRRPKQSQSAKRKSKPSMIAKARGPVRLASLETPGQLMNRAFLNRPSYREPLAF